MNEIELILLLLVAVAALTPTARKLRVPYPVLLVTGGLILALLPIVPDIPLDPELIFLFFLPPLVFRAAFTTSIRDFRHYCAPFCPWRSGWYWLPLPSWPWSCTCCFPNSIGG